VRELLADLNLTLADSFRELLKSHVFSFVYSQELFHSVYLSSSVVCHVSIIVYRCDTLGHFAGTISKVFELSSSNPPLKSIKYCSQVPVQTIAFVSLN